MENDIVIYERRENIAVLTINRPHAYNALTREVNTRLVELLSKAENDDEVRVVILTGSGEKAFAAGGDIKEMMHLDPLSAREYALQAKAAVDKIYSLKKPVIAAINGLCLGGGFEYAMACDFRVASEHAKFGLPEINLGVMPGSGGTQRLSSIIGMGKAKELIYTGSLIGAQEALEYRILNHSFPKETLMERTVGIAKEIASKSPRALSLIKSAMNRGAEVDLESGSMFEIDCFALCFATTEQKETMAAFVKKGSA